jgi:glyoxylase-like metal-dependent hydrolase (beta-lactamase superfamily II)
MFLEGIGQNQKSVTPDALDERSPLPAITGVTDTIITGAGGSDVHLLSLPTTHVEGILAAWVPAAKLLFVVDVLSPGAILPQLGSAEVEALLMARGLDAERIVGGHGGIANRADLQAAASQR